MSRPMKRFSACCNTAVKYRRTVDGRWTDLTPTEMARARRTCPGRNKGNRDVQPYEKECEFNRSMQHLLAVYWQGSGTLKFFAVVG